MLLTDRGKHLVRVVLKYSGEVADIVKNDPALRAQAGTTLSDFLPAVRGFLHRESNIDDLLLDSGRINQIQALVDEVKARGSDDLQSDLDKFMLDLRAEDGKRMSEVIRTVLDPAQSP